MLLFTFILMFAFESLAYVGKVLVVHNNQAVVEVDPEKAKIGDELMFYDKFLVQLGSAKIVKFGKKKSRALVKLPENMTVEKGNTIELLESVGPTPGEINQDQILKICYEHKKRESEKPKPVAEGLEMLLDGQSLKAVKVDETTKVEGQLRMSWLFVPGVQISMMLGKSASAGRGALGLVLNYPFHEWALPGSLFLGGYVGQMEVEGVPDRYSFSEVIFGQRVVVFERISWTPYIAQTLVSELQQEEVRLSLLSFSAFWP